MLPNYKINAYKRSIDTSLHAFYLEPVSVCNLCHVDGFLGDDESGSVIKQTVRSHRGTVTRDITAGIYRQVPIEAQ